LLVYIPEYLLKMIQQLFIIIHYSTIAFAIANILYQFYKNRKYTPSRKWHILTEKNGYVEIVPKFAHLEDQMDALVLAPKFIGWLNKFNPDQITLRSVTITDLDWFSAPNTPYNPLRLGFVKCFSEAYDFKTGKKIVSSISFIRGNSVAILILVKVFAKDKKNDKDYVLLCEQHRLPIGRKAMEIAAGMMDAEGNIISVVIKEVNEETGFVIKHESDLQNLGSYFASPGGSDEAINLFAWNTAISEAKFKEIQEKLYGLKEENEEIKLSFVELQEFKTKTVYEIGDAKAEIALNRYLARYF
jgi:8-oxo-dGTP pyrophosphatase MutT (NUDIX family)